MPSSVVWMAGPSFGRQVLLDARVDWIESMVSKQRQVLLDARVDWIESIVSKQRLVQKKTVLDPFVFEQKVTGQPKLNRVIRNLHFVVLSWSVHVFFGLRGECVPVGVYVQILLLHQLHLQVD